MTVELTCLRKSGRGSVSLDPSAAGVQFGPDAQQTTLVVI